MGLFKSKQEKEMEQRMIIKKTVNQFNKHIKELEDQKTKYLDAAKRAQEDGLTAQYDLAISGLKMAMTQQKKAKEMQLNFELASQMKDMTKVTSLFLDGMTVLSKEMSKTTKAMNFVKVTKEFETAITGVQMATDQLDILMETTNDSYSMVADQGKAVEDKDVEEFISAQTSKEDEAMNKEIEEQLAKLKSSIKE